MSWFCRVTVVIISWTSLFLTTQGLFIYVCLRMLSHVWLFLTPWTVARQAPLSMGILQARTLEWVAIFSPTGSFWPRDRTSLSWVFCIEQVYSLPTVPPGKPLFIHVCAVLSCSGPSDSLWPHGLQPASLLCLWNSPGKNPRVGCYALLQGMFPTQG